MPTSHSWTSGSPTRRTDTCRRLQPDLRTEDGGKTWKPWFDRRKTQILQPLRDPPVNGDLYIAGEGGSILKFDLSRPFKALSIPYKGSFFGLADAGTAVLVFGLRGNVYRSDDAGKTWAKVDAGLAAAVIGEHERNGAVDWPISADARW